MNKPLGPGILFLLSIILLYLGGSVNERFVATGLSVGGLVCLVLSVIGAIKKLFARGKKIDERKESDEA